MSRETIVSFTNEYSLKMHSNTLKWIIWRKTTKSVFLSSPKVACLNRDDSCGETAAMATSTVQLPKSRLWNEYWSGAWSQSINRYSLWWTVHNRIERLEHFTTTRMNYWSSCFLKYARKATAKWKCRGKENDSCSSGYLW